VNEPILVTIKVITVTRHYQLLTFQLISSDFALNGAFTKSLRKVIRFYLAVCIDNPIDSIFKSSEPFWGAVIPNALTEQEKNRVEHYVPLRPSVVSAISEVLTHNFGEKDDDKPFFCSTRLKSGLSGKKSLFCAFAILLKRIYR
jgi:hypothetical protein